MQIFSTTAGARAQADQMDGQRLACSTHPSRGMPAMRRFGPLQALLLGIILALLSGCQGVTVHRLKAAQLAPSREADSYSHYLAGVVHTRQGHFEKAAAEFEQVAQLAPEAQDIHRRLLALYLRLNDREKALEACRRALENKPEDTALWAMLGRIHLNAKDYDGAQDAFEEVVRLAPTRAEGYKVLISINEKLNDLVGTIEVYEKLIATHPGSAYFSLKLGLSLALLGDPVQTEKALTQALEIDPSLNHAYYLLGITYLDNDEPAKAIEALNTFLETEQDNPRVWAHLAGAHARLGQYDRTVELLGQLQDGGDEEAQRGLEYRYALLRAKRYAQVASMADDGTTPISSGFLRALASWLDGTHDVGLFESLDKVEGDVDAETSSFGSSLILTFGKADVEQFLVGAFEELARAGIHSQRVNILHARTLMVLDRHGEAEPILQGTLKRFGSDRWVHFYLAIVYDELDRFDDTVRHIKAALDAAPEDPDLFNFLGYVYAEENTNLDEAQELLEKALKVKPDSPFYLDSMGWVYYRKGEADKAIDYIRRAVIGMSSDDGILRDHLGDAYLLKGEVDRALAQWRRARRLDPELEGVQEKLDKYGSKEKP